MCRLVRQAALELHACFVCYTNNLPSSFTHSDSHRPVVRSPVGHGEVGKSPADWPNQPQVHLKRSLFFFFCKNKVRSKPGNKIHIVMLLNGSGFSDPELL